MKTTGQLRKTKKRKLGTATELPERATFKRGRYMIGTTAIHKLGDISRPAGDLCIVFSRYDKNFIGQWVTGFGFIKVKFPVATTRNLTAKERKR